MAVLELPVENRTLCVNFEDDALGEVLKPRKMASAVDPEREVRRALNNPIGSARLREVIPPGARPPTVALIVDDITRKTPTHLMLPHILEELAGAGVRDDAISIVIALGTHRPMTRDEIIFKFGLEISERYPIVNTAAWEKNSLKYMGESSNGVPAWVNTTVADADLRIGVGMIVPHMDAGFGGGAKIILPGVCGQRTVEAFHNKIAFLKESQLARTDANLRVDLEAFVAEKVPLHFILNAVLDAKGRIANCVAGHPVEAHRTGARLAMRIYGVSVARKYPVVLTNAYPYDIDFWQATKALGSAELMAEEGGSLILVAACRESFGEHPLLCEYLSKSVADLRSRIKTGRAADTVAASEAMALKMISNRFRIALVSSGITFQETQKMGFAYYQTVEEAVEGELAGRLERKVAVLTQGGAQVPFIKSDQDGIESDQAGIESDRAGIESNGVAQ